MLVSQHGIVVKLSIWLQLTVHLAIVIFTSMTVASIR
jgi:hypothetical protein